MASCGANVVFNSTYLSCMKVENHCRTEQSLFPHLLCGQQTTQANGPQIIRSGIIYTKIFVATHRFRSSPTSGAVPANIKKYDNSVCIVPDIIVTSCHLHMCADNLPTKLKTHYHAMIQVTVCSRNLPALKWPGNTPLASLTSNSFCDIVYIWFVCSVRFSPRGCF